MEKSQDTQNEELERKNMPKYYDFFMYNLSLLLNDVVGSTAEGTIVRESSVKYLEAIENNALDKLSNIIKKTYTTLGANLLYLHKCDSKIFQLKDSASGKKITIIPGIDLEEAFKNYDDTKKTSLWRYLRNIFYSSTKLLYISNPTCVSEVAGQFTSIIEKTIDYKGIAEEHKVKVPLSKLNLQYTLEKDFNPYKGIGNDTKGEFGIAELTSGTQIAPNNNGSASFNAVASFLGVDKVMEKLSEQLKNINKKDLDDAIETIKKALGDKVDSNTSEVIDMILRDITDELKNKEITDGNPATNIMNIAQSVAKRMGPKIDPKKLSAKKMMKSATKLAKNLTDEKGNKVFEGKDNPLNMLTNFMKSQIKIADGKSKGKSTEELEKNCMNDCNNMLKKMGLKETDLNKLKDLNLDQLVNSNKNEQMSTLKKKLED